MGKAHIIVSDDRYSGNYEIERRVLAAADMDLELLEDESDATFLAAAKNADGILVNLRKIDAELIAKLSVCKILSRYGVGYDNIDINAATAAGIWVSNVPDYSIEEVSDQAVALLMACARLVVFKDKAIRSGRWDFIGTMRVNRIAGRTLGLVGYGNIARRLHAKTAGFAFKEVLVYDPFVDAERITALGGKKCDLSDLVSRSDFISVHVPLTSDTRHLIGEREFALMRENAVLINTARGGIIDEAALCSALRSGKIRAAGLDVYEKEPLPVDSPLRIMDNVVLSDHCSYYSEEAMAELKEKAARNVVAALAEGHPIFPINKGISPRYNR